MSPGISGVAMVRVPPTWLRSANAPAATHSLFAVVVIGRGAAPTENGLPIGCPVRALSRQTVPSNSFATQMVLVVAARAVGPSPTGVVMVTLSVTRSIRDTDLDSELATQTLPAARR